MPLQERALALTLVSLACWCVLVLALRRDPRRTDVTVGVLLALGSVWWLFTSRAYEGPTVLELTPSRGLTAVDLAVPADLCLAAAVLHRAVTRRISARRPAGTPRAPEQPRDRGRSPRHGRARRS